MIFTYHKLVTLISLLIFSIAVLCLKNVSFAESGDRNKFVGGITDRSDARYDADIEYKLAGLIIKSDGTELKTDNGKIILDSSLTPLIPDVGSNGKYAGKYAFASDANNGDIFVKGLSNGLGIYGGYRDNTYQNTLGGANNNKVNAVNNSANFFAVYGGYNYKGNANNNIVKLVNTNSTNIWGGKVEVSVQTEDNFSANSNNVEIDGGTVNEVFGGNSDNGEANNNTVTVKNITSYIQTIRGGDSENGKETSGNTINIINLSNVYTVYGGYSQGNSNTNNNIINVKNSKIDTVFNGYSLGSTGIAQGNKIIADNTEFRTINNTYNGGDAYDNKVILTNSKVTGQLYTTYSLSGRSHDNLLTVKGGTGNSYGEGAPVGASYYGSYSEGDGYNNITNISDLNKYQSGNYGVIYGTYSSGGKAYANKLIVENTIGNTNGYPYGNIYGTYGKKDTYNNIIDVKKSKLKNLYGACTQEGSANKNTVSVTDSTVAQDVIIGYSNASEGSANENSLVLKKSNVNGNVYGGLSKSESNGNIIDIYSDNIIGKVLYGGIVGTTTSINETKTQLATGNTLNVYGLNNVANNINGFQKYNFYIPTNAVNNSTMLTLNGTEQTDILNSKVYAGIVEGNSNLKIGDKVNLMVNDNGFVTNANTTLGTLSEGVSLRYNLSVYKTEDNKKIVAELLGITSPTPKPPTPKPPTLLPQTNLFSRTPVITITNINKLQDFTVNNDLQEAILFANFKEKHLKGFFPFAGFLYDNMSYDINGSLDSKVYVGAIGFSRLYKYTDKNSILAINLETAKGNYITRLDNSLESDADTLSYGVGILGKINYKNGWFVESSIRYGKTESDVTCKNMLLGDKITTVKYDMDAPYWGFYLGTGYNFILSEKERLSLFGKFAYSSQASASAHLSTGEIYEFNSIDSKRTKLGFTYYKQDSKAIWNAGLIWQHEFSGTGIAKYKDFTTESVTLAGDSFITKIGVKYNFSNKMNVDTNLSFTSGKQHGVCGFIKVYWLF